MYMNRGVVDALVMFAAILFGMFLLDRADFMRLFTDVREFVSEHTEAVVVGLLALLSARLVLRSPQHVDKL